MLQKLQQKRAILIGQRDQMLGNLNLTIGAIAMIDELIGEVLAEASQAAAASSITTDARDADPEVVARLAAAAAGEIGAAASSEAAAGGEAAMPAEEPAGA